MNALFIHIPKTAGLYIQEALGLKLYRRRRRGSFSQTGMVTFGHQNIRKLCKQGVISPDFYASAWKFAFCRNPFDRAVSHYCYSRKNHPDVLPAGIQFKEFTGVLAKYDKHFAPQSNFLAGVSLDYLGRYENLDDNLAYVASTLGVQLKDTPRTNSTEHLDYRAYYDTQAERNIASYYAKDFTRFGYKNTIG